jgi:hypothetical protein
MTSQFLRAQSSLQTLRQVSGAFPGLETTHVNLKRYGTGTFARPLELRDGDTRHDLYLTLDGALNSTWALQVPF